MTSQTKSPLTDLDLIENPEPRLACVVLIDTSSSMSGSPINEVNQGLLRLNEEVAKDELTYSRAEICLIAFNNDWAVVQNFGEETDFRESRLRANGGTRMSSPIQASLDLIEERKQRYREHGIPYYRPIVMLITDGEPQHDTPAEIENAAGRIKEMQAQNHLTFFAIGTEGANMEMLNSLSNTPARRLQGTKFSELFQWLSNSMTAISQSSIGERVQLPSADAWAEY